MMPEQPNILLIFTDQQRWDTIHALGNPVIRTPTLDRLVRDGTAFTSAYTPSPVCVSARCSLLTGLPPHITGCTDSMPMPQERTSVMDRLHDAGYQTHGVGKMHFLPDDMKLWGFESRDVSEEITPLDSTEDDFRCFLRDRHYGHVHEPHGIRSEMYYIPQPSQLPAELHNTAWVADRSIDFLKRRDQSRPFFMWSSFIKPHPPFEVPTPWNKLYRTMEMPLPFRPEGYETLLTFWNCLQNRYKYRDSGYDPLLVRTIRAAYYACISFIDYHVGRILDALGDELDNTLIIYAADHGELMGDYGSFGKRSMVNPAVRVPLLARLPGKFPAGYQTDAPASLIDLWPTFLSAAGISPDEAFVSAESVNLAALAANPDSRDIVFSQFSHGRTGLYMAATRDSKYIYSAADEREWLFDLQKDPGESRSVAGNPLYSEKLSDMRDRLIQRFQKDNYLEPIAEGMWRQLGPLTAPDQEGLADFPLQQLLQGFLSSSYTSSDSGLLIQDPPGLGEQVAALKGYA